MWMWQHLTGSNNQSANTTPNPSTAPSAAPTPTSSPSTSSVACPRTGAPVCKCSNKPK